jgi:hypothetical protein
VKIKKKPETSAEKKQAEQEKRVKSQKKAIDRQRRAARVKQAQRTAEAKARLARGEISLKEAQDVFDEEIEPIEIQPEKKRRGLFGRIEKIDDKMNPASQDATYRKWRSLNYLFMGLALVFVALAVVAWTVTKSNWIVFLAPGYVFLALSYGIDIIKIRPLSLKYRTLSPSDMKTTPKRQKHVQAEQEKADQLAQARKEEKPPRWRLRRQSDSATSDSTETDV